jgi:hypothetical protein
VKNTARQLVRIGQLGFFDLINPAFKTLIGTGTVDI